MTKKEAEAVIEAAVREHFPAALARMQTKTWDRHGKVRECVIVRDGQRPGNFGRQAPGPILIVAHGETVEAVVADVDAQLPRVLERQAKRRAELQRERADALERAIRLDHAAAVLATNCDCANCAQTSVELREQASGLRKKAGADA